jgi:hypothetical protein
MLIKQTLNIASTNLKKFLKANCYDLAMSRLKAEPVLNEKWASFVQGGVSVVAGSRSADNAPTLARAIGCRVSPNRQKVTLFFHGPQAESLLASVRSTRTIAAVFTQPSTHTSIQLKGVDAAEGAVRSAHVDVANRSADAFVAETTPLGYPEDVLRAVLWFDPKDLVAVNFTPVLAFLQTPGPRAGEPLEA